MGVTVVGDAVGEDGEALCACDGLALGAMAFELDHWTSVHCLPLSVGARTGRRNIGVSFHGRGGEGPWLASAPGGAVYTRDPGPQNPNHPLIQ